MKRLLLGVILSLSMTSCARLNNEFCSWFGQSNSIYDGRALVQFPTDDLSEIVWNHAVKYKHERRLILDQAYVCMGENHSKLRLEFHSMAILDVRHARELLVDLVEDLLAFINGSDVAARLRPNPFTSDDLEIYINFESYYGLYVDPYYIGWIVLEKGTAYYYAFDLYDCKKKDCWHSRIEPYFKSYSYVNLRRQAEEIYKLEHPPIENQGLNELRYVPKRARQEPGSIEFQR